MVAAAAAKQVAWRTVLTVGAAGVEDQAVVAAVRILAEQPQPQRHVVAEVGAVAAAVGGSLRIRPDAVAAAEGEVGGALQAGSQVVAAGAERQGPLIGQVERHLPEECQLLLGAGVVVEERDRRGARAGRIDARRGQGGVAEQKAVAGVVVVEVVDVLGVRRIDRAIVIVTHMGGLRVVYVQAAEQSPASAGVRCDSEFVCGAGVRRVIHVLLGGVVAVVGIGRFLDVAAAKVVGDVAAAAVVVGVVHDAVHFAGEVPACVHQVQVGQAPVQRPSG